MGFLNGDLMVIEWDFGGDSISDKLHSPRIYGDFHYVIVINGDKLWFMVI